MDITHPGQQLIFYFEVFVEFFLDLFHYLFCKLESLLFHVCMILFICFFLFGFCSFMFNKYHIQQVTVSFDLGCVYACCFVLLNQYWGIITYGHGASS